MLLTLLIDFLKLYDTFTILFLHDAIIDVSHSFNQYPKFTFTFLTSDIKSCQGCSTSGKCSDSGFVYINDGKVSKFDFEEVSSGLRKNCLV